MYLLHRLLISTRPLINFDCDNVSFWGSTKKWIFLKKLLNYTLFSVHNLLAHERRGRDEKPFTRHETDARFLFDARQNTDRALVLRETSSC